MIFVTVDIEPIPKGRPRMTRQGRTYTPKRTSDYEGMLRYLVADKYRKGPVLGPLRVELKLSCKAPKTSKNGYPRADVDNMAKAVLDAMNGLLWDDDSQILELFIVKEYAPNPQVAILVSPIESLQDA